eukprot:COSAG05_NODE_97_length_19444_cov_8.577174_6_plen_194_part_00
MIPQAQEESDDEDLLEIDDHMDQKVAGGKSQFTRYMVAAKHSKVRKGAELESEELGWLTRGDIIEVTHTTLVELPASEGAPAGTMHLRLRFKKGWVSVTNWAGSSFKLIPEESEEVYLPLPLYRHRYHDHPARYTFEYIYLTNRVVAHRHLPMFQLCTTRQDFLSCHKNRTTVDMPQWYLPANVVWQRTNHVV